MTAKNKNKAHVLHSNILECEWALILRMINHNEDIGHIADKLEPGMFNDKQARMAYQAILARWGEGKAVDVVGMSQALKKDGIYPADIVKKMLDDHIDSMSTVVSVDSLVDAIHENGMRIMLEKIGSHIVEKLRRGENPIDVKEDALQSLIETETSSESRVAFIDQQKANDFLDDVKNMDKDKLITGYTNLDSVISLRRKQYIVIAGRPQTCKTTLALNVLLRMANSGQAVGMISMETDLLNIKVMLTSIVSGIAHRDIRSGIAYGQELDRALLKMSRMRFAISDIYGMTFSRMRNEIRRMKAAYKDLCCVAVDHLGLVRGSGKGGDFSRNFEIGEISRGIKSMCKEFNLSLIVISQLNRAIEKEMRPVPRLSDLRDCGDIEQDADVIIGGHMVTQDIPENTRYFRILKNKEGETNADIVFNWKPTCFRMDA